MRIVLITTSFLPRIGGAEFAVHHLAQRWSEQGHEVFVLNYITDRATHPEARYQVRCYPLLRGAFHFGYHRFPYAPYEAFHLRRLLREIGPDFISAHFGYPVAIWLGRLNPVPRFTITCHGEELHESSEHFRSRYRIDSLLAASLNRASSVIAISSFARDVLEQLGVQSERIRTIPNGADRKRFAIEERDFNFRERLGLPSGSLIVLSVGRNHAAKAYDVGLRAFAGALEGGLDGYYALVGKSTARWRPLAAELGIADRVRFVDGLHGADLVGAYQQADIFFMPSAREVCPLAVPEAMAAGRPAVVSDVGGCQDMVEDGSCGLVVPPGDVTGFSAALLRLAGSSLMRREMGAAARERSAVYDWETISRRYLELA